MKTIKVKAEFTGYMIRKHRCSEGVIVATRVHVGKAWLRGMHEDGTPLAKGEYCRTVPCAGCGAARDLSRFEPIMGKLVEMVVCNAKCMGATSSACSCSCGGLNHGGKFTISTGEAFL